MCGIAGIVDFRNTGRTNEIIRRATASMNHRGPDFTGYYDNGPVSLGHNRLSIIDLNNCSNQPMADNSGRYHIVFNGEIYNFRQLRSRLTNYPYTTNGDTETILAAYCEWGQDCVKELAGMFAFAIWDSKDESLFLARDRLGVKPLYYTETASTFLFASEIRAILRTGEIAPALDDSAASEFLQFQSISFPATIVENISSLEAGTWMKIARNEKLIGKYWNITHQDRSFDYQDADLVRKTIRAMLMRSVERRMVSDVPVAAFLSGGIDSSAVVGMMSSIATEPVNTFTVAFGEQEFDESPYAETIAKKFRTRHHEVKLHASDFLHDLLPALNAMDFPSGDGVNSYVVSKAIAKNNIKVALSGAGGDELFAGYPIFKQFHRLMKLRNWWRLSAPLRNLSASALLNKRGKGERMAQLLRADYPGIAAFYPPLRQVISRSTLIKCTSLPPDTGYPMHGVLQGDGNVERLPILSQLSVAEYFGYTQHTLLRDMDQMSMANSLEVREPFFDHELVSFVLNVPDHLKYPHYPKKLLVESLGDLLPSEIVHRKKRGFEFPWKIWMKTELKDFCEQHLQAIAERPFINRKPLMEKWKRFLSGDPEERWMELWLFVVLEHWLNRNEVR